jgi:hypothetical protein
MAMTRDALAMAAVHALNIVAAELAEKRDFAEMLGRAGFGPRGEPDRRGCRDDHCRQCQLNPLHGALLVLICRCS